MTNIHTCGKIKIAVCKRKLYDNKPVLLTVGRRGWKTHLERKKKMYIIAGLGNPTKEYEGTRHNVGFDVIDRLSERYNIDVTMEKHRALIGKGMIAGQKVILVKPQTYMNLSGEASEV